MTTPFVSAHPASVDPLLKKALPAANAAKAGQEAEATGFDEMLTREMGDGFESSPARGMRKGERRVPGDMPDAANVEIPEAAVKSTKGGRVREKSNEEDLDSKIDVLVQQFMQGANPPSELIERQRALSAMGIGKATGVALEGEEWTGKNKEPEFRSGEHDSSIGGPDVMTLGVSGAILGERAQGAVNFRGGAQETGIQAKSDDPSVRVGRELALGVPSGLPEAMPGLSSGVAQHAAAIPGSIARDSIDAGAQTRPDMSTLQSGALGGERRVEFPPKLASHEGGDRLAERRSETASVIGTHNSLATHGGVLPSPGGDSSMALQSVAPADHSLLLQPRIDSSAWGDALNQKVLWMVTQQQQTAELSLNPPDLGPLQVVLSVDNDQASAMFVSQNADVRQALEGALPRLKEMMAESGISLGSTTVSAGGSHSNGQDRPGSGSPSSNPGSSKSGMESSIISVGPGRSVEARGLVDTFA